MCAISHIRHLYTVLNFAELPPSFFIQGLFLQSFVFFDCYVKLAFILILMSVFQLL